MLLLLLLLVLECDDDVTVTFVAFMAGCVVVTESEPNCDAIMEVRVRLLGEELRVTPEGGTVIELSLFILLLLLLPAIVLTELGGG